MLIPLTVSQGWLSVTVYAVAALIIVIVNEPNLARQPTAQMEAARIGQLIDAHAIESVSAAGVEGIAPP